jgi:hypothetical protein
MRLSAKRTCGSSSSGTPSDLRTAFDDLEMATEIKTLQEAILYFADPKHCREYLVARRWPNGVICPRYGSFPRKSTIAGSAIARPM